MYFRGEYDFLSNFYKCNVEYEGVIYSSVENAFQAAKTLDLIERRQFEDCTAREAKKLGKTVKLRSDWENVKVKIMCNLVFQKFNNSEYLRTRLLIVQDKIIEENFWHDNFWGICKCGRCTGGYNMLGNILQEVREHFNSIV